MPGSAVLKSVCHNEAIVKKEKLQDVVGSDEYRTHNVLEKEYQPLPIPDVLQNAESLVGRYFHTICSHTTVSTLLRC